MIYCDTSLLASALTAETNRNLVVAWLADPAVGLLAISAWTITAFASALARKQWQGQITVDTRAVIETTWRELIGGFELLPVTTAHFKQAAQLIDAGPHGLRAGDALRLAIALAYNCTLDRNLADAGQSLGVVVHQPA